MSALSIVNGSDERALAARCLSYDPEALRALERDYVRQTEPLLKRLGLGPADRDEIRQRLWVRLLVGDRPRLALFTGNGGLLAFVRAVALRLALDERRRLGDSPEDESVLLGVADPSQGPELAVMKRMSRAQFRAAFEAALAALTPKQRTILRQTYLDGLSNQAIAHLHGAHRATIFRWTTEARRSLDKHLREELARSLRISAAEIPPFASFLESQLSLSLPRVLA
jgi:RNA polymerase sigma-70 factor (ECF subfamily)